MRQVKLFITSCLSKPLIFLILITGFINFCPAQEYIDPSTMDNKLLFGYQGWFDCPDGSGDSWVHWGRGNPSPGNLTVEMYPDLSEFDKDDLCESSNFSIDGEPALFYSSLNYNVADKHFEWMKEYGLDGVLVQRFVHRADRARSSGDVVLKNAMAAAEKYGRVFAIEYDVNGSGEDFDDIIKDDWRYLVDELKLTESPSYLHHEGKPVMSVWGPGNSVSGGKPPENVNDLLTFIKWFKQDAPERFQATYMGGTPHYWRELRNDSRTDPAWLSGYGAMDIIQPWNVGRVSSYEIIDGRWAEDLVDDETWTRENNNRYMPVIFPGFSWSNKKDAPQNQIPRDGGNFFWQQAVQALKSGVSMIKVAMFDEVDEATAMYKLAPTRDEAPDQAYWLTLDADGFDLPSDWYLRLAGEVTGILKGIIPLSETIQLDPNDAYIPPGQRVSVKRPETGRDGTYRLAGQNIVLGGNVFTRAEIVNLQGKVIKNVKADGNNRVVWNKTDSNHAPVSTGVYLVKLTGNNFSSFIKLFIKNN